MVHVAKVYMTLHILMVSFTYIDPESADSDNTTTIAGIVAGVIVVIGIIVMIIGAVLFYHYRKCKKLALLLCTVVNYLGICYLSNVEIALVLLL